MKILLSFTRPHVAPNLCDSFAGHKEDILKNVSVFILFIQWKSMGSTIMPDLTEFHWNILQNNLLCVLQKKETHTGLEQDEGE